MAHCSTQRSRCSAPPEGVQRTEGKASLSLKHVDAHRHHALGDHVEPFCRASREVDDPPAPAERTAIIHGDTHRWPLRVRASDTQASSEWQRPVRGAEPARIIRRAARRRIPCQAVGIIRCKTAQHLARTPREIFIRTAGTRGPCRSCTGPRGGWGGVHTLAAAPSEHDDDHESKCRAKEYHRRLPCHGSPPATTAPCDSQAAKIPHPGRFGQLDLPQRA